MRTLDQLKHLVPSGPAQIVHMGLGGPYQLQTPKLVLVHHIQRLEVAEYLCRLWNIASTWHTMGPDDSAGGSGRQELDISKYDPGVPTVAGPEAGILPAAPTTRAPRKRR